MFKKIVKWLIILLAISLAIIIVWPEKTYEPHRVSSAYQAQVDAYNVPDMPPDWEWKTYTTSDGTRLRWGETGNRDAAKATLLIVPGYTATLSMYGEHIDMWARIGYHIVGLDLRGQGGSQRHRDNQPEKLWVKDFSVYSNDVAAFIKSLPERKDRPLILMGISFGGHVATRTVGDNDVPVDALYLNAPALRPQSTPYTFEQARRLMSTARVLGKSKYYVYGQTNWESGDIDFKNGSDCSSNPLRLHLRDAVFTRDPAQRVGGITNQWGAEFFESSDYVLRGGYLEKITQPVTLISAGYDAFVVTDYNSQACRDRFVDCREVKISNTGHCLLQESDAVIAQMTSEVDALFERVKNRPTKGSLQ